MPEHFIVVGSSIIEKDGKILLVKEGKDIAEDTWNLPGGSMESFENPRECSVREALEETGLEINPDSMVGVYIDTSDDNSEKVFNFVYCSEPENSQEEVREEDTVKDLKWFKPEEIADLNLRASYIEKAVEDFIQGKRLDNSVVNDTTI